MIRLTNIPYEKLRIKFAECQLTQKDIAAILGMSRATLNAKLNAMCPFSLDEVYSLCEVLSHIKR